MKNMTKDQQAVALAKNSEAVLTSKDLTIGYKSATKRVVVAENLNVRLEAGQLICLLGANGTGKSTLMRTIAGIQPPLAGQVWLNDEEISNISKKRLARKLSLVLTESPSAGNLTAYSIISLGRYPYLGWFGKLRSQDSEIIKKAVAVTGIYDFLNSQINELSDGQKQKVMIARALVQDTPVILLDEPTAHLDLPNRVEVIRLLRKMARETGKAIVVSTHELDLALQAADKIWLITPERQIICGVPEDLILNRTFEDAFKRNGFDFCRKTGTFKVNIPEEGKYIAVKGGHISNFWTRRALEREGFTITDSNENQIIIREENDNIRWTLTDKVLSKDIYSIQELIYSLNLILPSNDRSSKEKEESLKDDPVLGKTTK